MDIEIEKRIMQVVRSDPSVIAIQRIDSQTEIYIRELNVKQIRQINQDYPGLFPPEKSVIYVVNVISSIMEQGIGYKKIRFYLSATIQIIKKFESGN
jgi:hypothetical protein